MPPSAIFQGKKAQNDTTIIAGFVIFFIICAILIPYIATEFGQTSDILDYISLQNTVKNTQMSGSWFGFLLGMFSGLVNVVLAIFLMATWSMGIIPAWVELIIFLPIRIIFWFLIYRAIRSGSG